LHLRFFSPAKVSRGGSVLDKLSPIALRKIARLFTDLPNLWTRRFFADPAPLATAHAGETLLHLTILLPVAVSLLFIRLSCPLLEPEETRYAEIARQMLVHGHFSEPIWHGQPYYHKPPLLYWLVMGCYQLFGIHDWAARLVPALASLGTVVVTYLWGRHAFGARIGCLSALILCLSARFIYLGRMVTMDALLCLWVVAALAAAHRAVGESPLRRGWWTVSALAAGLGLLTKGPVTLVLVLVPITLFQKLDQRAARPSWRAGLFYIAVALGVASPWYVAMIWNNPAAAGEFFWLHHVQRYLDPIDHEEPLWFFLPGLLLGTLPWSLLLIPMAKRSAWNAGQRPAALGLVLLALIWCVGFFSLSGCKRVGYVLPGLPLLALCCGCGLGQVRRAMHRRLAVGCAMVMFALLLAGVYTWLPSYHRRFALRGQVRRFAEVAAQDAVYCYPKRWDSVTFYLQREDVRVFTTQQREELVAAAMARPKVLLFVKTRFLQELLTSLPPDSEFVVRGRQGTTLTVGMLRTTRLANASKEPHHAFVTAHPGY
jgi:4-amino-4-deoxy-L-arabinose transferase-like glycosyltransferase